MNYLLGISDSGAVVGLPCRSNVPQGRFEQHLVCFVCLL